MFEGSAVVDVGRLPGSMVAMYKLATIIITIAATMNIGMNFEIAFVVRVLIEDIFQINLSKIGLHQPAAASMSDNPS